ncbi:MAG TPA: tetratricopeptide repeat protein, partial [Flavobacteriales bacterium]|nr:tetratricopeptide repeat protein [Flavobacteriales bacterium]
MRLLAFCILLVGSATPGLGQGIFDRALDTYLNGSGDTSIVLFTAAIAQGDQPARAHMMRGAAYFALDDFPRGRADLDSAKALDASLPKLAYYYGRWHLFQGQYTEALDHFNAALRVDSTHADAWNCRAMCRCGLGDPAGAITDEDQAIRLATPKDKGEYLTNRGWAHVMLHDYPTAIQDLTAAIAIAPDQKAYADRGFAYMRSQKYAPAVEDFTRSLEIVAEDADVLYYRGLCNTMLGYVMTGCADQKKSAALGHQKA